jgi:hypothetical protein
MILTRQSLMRGGRIFTPRTEIRKPEDREHDENGKEIKEVVEVKAQPHIAKGIVAGKPQMEKIVKKLAALHPTKKRRISFVPKIRKDVMP